MTAPIQIKATPVVDPTTALALQTVRPGFAVVLAAAQADAEWIARVAEFAKTATVTDDDAKTKIHALTVELKRRAKALDEYRKAEVAPFNTVVNTVNGTFMPPIKLAAEAEADLKRAIGTYTVAQRQLEARAFSDAVQLAGVGAVPAAQQALAVSTSAGQSAATPTGTAVREVWKARIANAAAVPREWCVVDEKRIAATARATPANEAPPAIPGVEFYKEAAVSVKTGI